MNSTKVPIVDIDDNIIDYKSRSAINFSKDIFRTASLWITNSQGDILLAQRKYDKKVDPGKWAEAVGGTVENDDTYEKTALREANEELGLKGISLTLGPKQFITVPCQYFVQWYTLGIDQAISLFTIQKEEVEAIAWIPETQFVKELQTRPGKYIPAMKDIAKLFIDL